MITDMNEVFIAGCMRNGEKIDTFCKGLCRYGLGCLNSKCTFHHQHPASGTNWILCVTPNCNDPKCTKRHLVTLPNGVLAYRGTKGWIIIFPLMYDPRIKSCELMEGPTTKRYGGEQGYQNVQRDDKEHIMDKRRPNEKYTNPHCTRVHSPHTMAQVGHPPVVRSQTPDPAPAAVVEPVFTRLPAVDIDQAFEDEADIPVIY